MAYCKEKDLQAYADYKQFPIIPCNLCGSQENLQRQNIKQMLADWERTQPGRVASIFGAIQNIAPSQLADSNLFDFKDLTLSREGERAPYPFEDELSAFGSETFGGAEPKTPIDNSGRAVSEGVVSESAVVKIVNL